MEKVITKQSPREWLNAFDKAVTESTGSSMWGADDNVYNGALVMVTIIMFGSMKDKDIQRETGLGIHIIHRVKQNMRRSRMIMDLRSPHVRTNPIRFTIDLDMKNPLESVIEFVMNAMVAGGELVKQEETYNIK